MRFYVEGQEVDVDEPYFFIDEKEYRELQQTLQEVLGTYARNIHVDTQRKEKILYNSDAKKRKWHIT
jgi:hypothetical protein